MTVQPGDEIEDAVFKPGFAIVEFLNQVVESQLILYS
jgi:hypothetical protein